MLDKGVTIFDVGGGTFDITEIRQRKEAMNVDYVQSVVRVCLQTMHVHVGVVPESPCFDVSEDENSLPSDFVYDSAGLGW